jgi:serine kinase of HPr protein (carbohydrate metabolism regulator)
LQDAAENHHGTAICIGERAVLIRGAPGAGKSDLALRCLGMAPSALVMAPAQLVADDQVLLSREGQRLRATAPDAIRGKLEVRGLGIVTIPHAASAYLELIADLADPGTIERMPDPPPTAEVMGLTLPLLRLAPFEAAAPIKLLLALAQTRRTL